MYNLHAFEKIFFSLTVDYDVIDHVTLGWLEECSPRKNKSRLWTLQDSVERSLVPKFVRLLGKKACLLLSSMSWAVFKLLMVPENLWSNAQFKNKKFKRRIDLNIIGLVEPLWKITSF